MLKKIILLFASIGVFFAILVSIRAFSQAEGIECTVISEDNLTKLYETLSESTTDMLSDLSFNQQALPYDADTATYYLPLSINDDTWEKGVFTTSSSETEIVFLDAFDTEDKLKCISQNKAFRFLAYNETSYQEYQLVFTGLPSLTIQTIEAADSEHLLADFVFYDNSDSLNAITESKGYLKLRGATSRSFPKYSYSIELMKELSNGTYDNNNVSLLGMRQDNDWILNALYSDDTKIRDKLSSDIWNAMGATLVDSSSFYGFHMEYIEVFLNDQYIGLYGLLEPVDRKQLDINSDQGEYLYKRATSTNIDIQAFDVEEGSSTEDISLNGFELKGNKNNVTASDWEPLKNFMSLLTESSDAEFQKTAAEYIDIDNALNVWMFLQVICGADNVTKNMYYAYSYVGTDYQMHFVPWDLDLTWGNEFDEFSPIYSSYDEDNVTKLIPWEPGQKIYDLDISNTIYQVQSRWKSLRADLLSDANIAELIQTDQNTIYQSGAMTRDSLTWEDSPHTEDYKTILNFALDRLAFLDTYFLESE